MLKNKLRSARLTRHMKELLMDCFERQLLEQEPFDIGAHYANGLLRRGFLEAKKFTNSKGKELMGLFLTDEGRKYLNSLE